MRNAPACVAAGRTHARLPKTQPAAREVFRCREASIAPCQPLSARRAGRRRRQVAAFANSSAAKQKRRGRAQSGSSGRRATEAEPLAEEEAVDDWDADEARFAEPDELEAAATASGDEGPVMDAGSTTWRAIAMFKNDSHLPSWGRQALEAAEQVLRDPSMQGLDLHSFRAIPHGCVVDVRLDKLEDRYGSPTVDDIEDFSRRLYQELTAMLGEEEAGRLTLEVSSPGAERKLRIPAELERFADLPMAVAYRLPDAAGTAAARILQLVELDADEACSTWQLADVRANRAAGKGGLTKKQASERFDIPLERILRAQLFVDI